MSAERRQRIREQAVQKLAKAFALDEIACCVATMQASSCVDEVAELVLQRNPHHLDAKYVQFFQEKIPSRQVAEYTSLGPLHEIICLRQRDPEPLRTRGIVRILKKDYRGAVDDFTEALRLYRRYRVPHEPPPKPRAQEVRVDQRSKGVKLKEDDQPNSLELQLHFQRSVAYLLMATDLAAEALPSAFPDPDYTLTSHDTVSNNSGADEEAQKGLAEVGRVVRHNAKRALRDLLAILSQIEYSPDFPIEIEEDFLRRVTALRHGIRVPRSSSHRSEDTADTYHVYPVSDLFSASPPTDLPQFHSSIDPLKHPFAPKKGIETLSCHPVLTEVLHSVLLCHCLLQTPPQELLRHALMVARLTRLADGFPILQASRSRARTDWVDVLRVAGNWIELPCEWDDLCTPKCCRLLQDDSEPSHPTSADASLSHIPGTGQPEHNTNETEAVQQQQQKIEGVEQIPKEQSVTQGLQSLDIGERRLHSEHHPLPDHPNTSTESIYDSEHPTSATSAANLTSNGAANNGEAQDTINSGQVEGHMDKGPRPKPIVSSGTVADAVSHPKVVPSHKSAHNTTCPAGHSSPSLFVPDAFSLSERAAVIARWVLEGPNPAAADGDAENGEGGEGPKMGKKKVTKRRKGVRSSETGASAAGHEGHESEHHQYEGGHAGPAHH